MMKGKLYFFFLATLILLQTMVLKATPWEVSPKYATAFIENKGQFNGRNKIVDSQILYAIDHGPFQVYFTNKGFTYRLDEKYREKATRDFKEKMREAREEMKEKAEGKFDVKMKSDLIHVEFLNCNSNVTIEPSGKLNEYFNYGMGSNNLHFDFISGYEKITYKQLYPGVDLIFTFDEKGGFKYSFQLNAGVDPSVILMRYNQSAKVSVDEAGNLLLKTRFGNIIDHAPVSYIENSNVKIATQFLLNGKTVSFKIDDYDKTKSLIIDPWVLFPSSPNSNKVWEVETDNLGNVYTYAGDMPFVLRKYNPSGILQWSYVSSWDSSGFWVGGMLTHPNGDTYMCTGSNGELRKINSSGTQVWYNNPNGFLNTYEYWSIAFNCDLTKLVVGGSKATFSIPFPVITGNIMQINLANGSVQNNVTVAYGSTANIPPNIQEVSSICYAPNGRYYFLTLDTVGAIKDDLTSINFKTPTNYSFDYYIPGYGFGTKQPISAIRADANYFYTHNGITLHKRDLNTGAVIASASIPSGISSNTFLGRKVQGNGGLDIDSCGNIYVGSGNGVYKFDGNLNLIASENTTGPVYDVDVSKNGEVAMCGSNFAGSVALNACSSFSPICITTVTVFANATNVSCNGQCNGTATANGLGGTAPYTYQWSNGLSTASISGLCAGIYTVTITDAAGLTDTAFVTVTTPSAIAGNLSVINASCSVNGSATIIASGGIAPYTYLWSTNPAQTTLTATNLTAGNYTVTVTDANGCTFQQTATITSPSGIVATVSSVNTTCGKNNGTASANVTSGTAPFTYLWSTVPSQATATVSGLAAGSYSVVITDAIGCTTQQTITINASTGVAATASSVPSCGDNNGNATVTVTSGAAPYSYLWYPSGANASSINGLAAGIYKCVITDNNGCADSVYVQVNTFALPVANAGADTTINSNNTLQLNASGGISYLWTPVDNLSCSNCANPVASLLSDATYCVEVTDINGCRDTDCITITIAADCGEIYVPSAFSPDGASNIENQKQCVYGKCIQSMTFAIFSRWGEKVFETTDQRNCWDGTYKGEPLNSGVYAWTLNATLIDGTVVTKKGDVTLFR
ncbi:MAG: gliding motility-associated C-terminal domain-containing protein [Bacteroidota bacterium]